MSTKVKNSTEIDIYKLSDEITTSSKDIDKHLEKIINVPFYKKIMFKFSKNKQLRELEEAFNYFENKKNQLYVHKEEIKNLESILLQENKQLEKHIAKLKNKKDADVELLVQLETKMVVNSEILMNEIPILNEMISNILNKLEKTLPFIERTVKQRLTINTTLKTLQYVIEKTIELEEYSKQLEIQNSKTIKRMVSTSTEMIVNSIDIEYYKNMKKRNEELTKLFETSKKKYAEKMAKMEKELTSIIDNTKAKEVTKKWN